MENISRKCSSHVYIGSDVKGKYPGIKCCGIYPAVANAVSPSYHLLGISLSDLELNCENLTLTFIVDRTQEQNQCEWQRPDLPRKFPCSPPYIQLLHRCSVLGIVQMSFKPQAQDGRLFVAQSKTEDEGSWTGRYGWMPLIPFFSKDSK